MGKKDMIYSPFSRFIELLKKNKIKSLESGIIEVINTITNSIEREMKKEGGTKSDIRSKIIKAIQKEAYSLKSQIIAEIKALRPMGRLSELSEVIKTPSTRKRGVDVSTPFGTYVFAKSRMPSSEDTKRWYNLYNKSEILYKGSLKYSFPIEMRPNTWTGNFRIVESGSWLRERDLLDHKEKDLLEKLETFWKKHPNEDKQKFGGYWTEDSEIITTEEHRAISEKRLKETKIKDIKKINTTHLIGDFNEEEYGKIDKEIEDIQDQINKKGIKSISNWEKLIDQSTFVGLLVDIEEKYEKRKLTQKEIEEIVQNPYKLLFRFDENTQNEILNKSLDTDLIIEYVVQKFNREKQTSKNTNLCSINPPNIKSGIILTNGYYLTKDLESIIKSKDIPKEELCKVLVQCPKCKKTKSLEIPKKIFTSSSGITNILINSGEVCEHTFICHVDNNCSVRGNTKVDFEV